MQQDVVQSLYLFGVSL